MKFLGVFAASSLATVAIAQPYSPIRIGEVAAAVEAENAICQDGQGDDPATDPACDRRDQLVDLLKKHGICWGPASAAEAGKHWVRCTSSAQ